MLSLQERHLGFSTVHGFGACKAVGSLLCLLSLLVRGPALSQTKWFKYEGNPVLDVGPPDNWDATDVFSPRVISVHDTLKMWYVGTNHGGNNDRVGYAWSTDGGTSWTKYASNPVVIPTQKWENGWTYSPYIIFDGLMYKMWYTGNDGHGHIGYAVSRDGIHWTKYRHNPVIRSGWQSASWDERWIAWPSVIGPDSVGQYKMWYESHNSSVTSSQIGYAIATDETTWFRAINPVLSPNAKSWDSSYVRGGRVLFDDRMYMIWYSGGKHRYLKHKIGYATSRDGITWKKFDTPVLGPGPDPWDRVEVFSPEVLFDGSIYQMWYAGHGDSSRSYRIGYAVSPEGMNIFVSHANRYVWPKREKVRIGVRLDHPDGITFSASIRSLVDSLDWNQNRSTAESSTFTLFDDGQHGDDRSGDGIFSNYWIPPDESIYVVDLAMEMANQSNRRFELKEAATFTTIGPIRVQHVEIKEDKPGDSVSVVLVLQNYGTSERARSISTALSVVEPGITVLDTAAPSYADIPPSAKSSSLHSHRLYISPEERVAKDAKIDVTISSLGIPLWRDSFILHLSPPWWRSSWAYTAYFFLLIVAIGGIARFIEIRRLKNKVRQLEQEGALERERARISQDMHDEIGATLTEIAILSELAKKKPDQAAQHIQQISDRAASVIDGMGEIIWAMSPKNDSLDNLVAHLRREMTKHLELANIRCQFTAPDPLPDFRLSSEAKRNIFLVVKEAVHNCVKHSGATRVSISVGPVADSLQIVITDNGRGFDVKGRTITGNGLSNMHKRATDISGTLKIESQPGNGTKVTISSHLRSITPFT